MAMSDAFLDEFDYEAATTRRLFERVPDDHFDWKPHEKSFTLHQLTQHMAEMPGWMRAVGGQDELDLADAGDQPRPTIETTEDLLRVFDENVAVFRQEMQKLSDDDMMKPWRLRTGEKVHFEVPRVGAIRTFVLSHLIHHRGQLAVYLRLLDVPIPSIYGPSADDNVFE